MRTVGVVTVGRSDWGIYRPVLDKLRDDPDIDLRLFASGMHLSASHGRSLGLVEADGFEVARRVETILASDTPQGIAKSMALGIAGFAQVFEDERPDVLLLLGDRFEMFAAAAAAVPFRIPLAHIHGGEVTRGAIDEAFRHSLTKMSHLHFVSTEAYAARVRQLGEEAWRVHVVGAPALDNLRTMKLLSRAELEKELGIPLDPAPLVVTFHPVTLEHDKTPQHVEAILGALAEAGRPVVFTMPNADTGHYSARTAIEAFVARHPSAHAFENLGSMRYYSLLHHAAAMVGNSSSGIIEAPSFGLPVVNVGTRQEGRVRGAGVLDVDFDRLEILKAIRQATAPVFRERLEGKASPYGDGRASDRILEILKSVELGDRLLLKRFIDQSGPGGSA